MKKRKTKAYIFYSVILFLVLAVVLILRTNIVENMFKGRIEKFITDKTGIPVTIGSITVSILSSSVTVSSLVVKGDAAYHADIGKLTVVFEPPSILKDKPQLKTVAIEDAHIALVLRQKLPGKMHGTVPSFDISTLAAGLPVTIKHIVVSRTALSISMPDSDTAAQARDVSLSLYPEPGRDSVSGLVDIKGLALSRQGSTVALNDCQFSGAMKGRDITVNSLRVASDAVHLDLSGKIVDYQNPYVRVNVKASVKTVQQFNAFLKTLPVALPAVGGSYTFDGSVTGSILNPSSFGIVGFRDLEISGVRGGTGTVSYVYKSRKLLIKKADITVAGGTVKATGNVDFSDDSLPASFSLDLDHVSFGQLLSDLTVPHTYVDAGITGHVEVKGRFNPVYFAGNVGVQFLRFSVYDNDFNSTKKNTIMVVKPVNIQSNLILTNQCAYITNTTVQTARSLLHNYTALYFTGAMFLTFDSHDLDMQDVSPIAFIPYTGKGSARGYIAGPFTDITIHGDVAFHDFSMEHIPLGTVTGGITFYNNVLALESIHAVHRESQVDVDGGIHFTQDIGLQMEAKLQPVALKDIADTIGDPFTAGGSISGTVRIDGPAGRMNGSADLTLIRPDAYFQSFDSGTVHMTMEHGRFHFDSALLKKGDDTLAIGGYIAEDGDLGLTFETRGFHIDEMDALTRLIPGLQGIASFNGSLGGTVQRPSGSMRVHLSDLVYNKARIPDCSASVGFTDDTFSTDADMFDHSLGLRASLGVRNGYPFTLRTQFTGFDARPVISAVSGISMTSDVSGTLWMTGRLDAVPASLVGYLYLDSASFGNRFASFRSGKPVFVDMANNTISFREFSLRGKKSALDISGFFNLNGSADTLIHADVDLSYVPLFTSVLAGASGRLKIDTRIEGAQGNVMMNGTAELNGDAVMADEPVSFTGMNIGVLMANKNIVIKDISGLVNGGTLSGSGRIIMAGVMPRIFDLNVNFKGVNFVYRDTVPLQMDGTLGLKGLYPRPSIEGDVRIINATYTDYINWEDEMLKFQRRKYVPQNLEQGTGTALPLNIRVEADKSIVIDNNILNSVLSAQLRVEGTVERPEIIGNISGNGGKLYYRSTVFSIDNAVVTYTREHPGNPFVDLRASTTQDFMVNNEYSEYNIYLTIAGKLDKLNVSLTSYPPSLDEMDIISLLTYGVTPSDLMKSGISSAAAYEVGTAVGSKLAKDIFSEMVGNESLNKFRKIFWIDNLQISPYYPIGAPTSSIRLTVTKRITSDLDILYSYDLSGYNLQRFQGQYKLSKRLYFLGSWDNNTTTQQSINSNNNVGNFGGDLKYKYEF